MIFLSLKKLCDNPKFFFKPNITKLWTKLDNKLSCKLRLQVHSIFFYIGCEF